MKQADNITTGTGYGSTKHVQKPLQMGAHVNKTNNDGHNALMYHIITEERYPEEQLLMLLFAVGESPNCTTYRKINWQTGEVNIIVPEYLLNPGFKGMSLKATSRLAIRKHLNLNPHLHLLRRIPSLPLPTLLIRYL